VLDGVASRGASVPDAELMKNRAQMRVDRSAAEKERLGDLVVGHSPRHQPQDLDLSRRQVLEAGRYRRLRFRQLDAPRRRRAVMPRGQKWHPLCRSIRYPPRAYSSVPHTASQSLVVAASAGIPIVPAQQPVT